MVKINYKEEYKGYRNLSLFLFVLFMVFGFLWAFDVDPHTKFKKQLEECREKVPIWNLEVECWDDDSTLKVTFKDDLDSYELYEAEKDFLIKMYDHCEVKDGI